MRLLVLLPAASVLLRAQATGTITGVVTDAITRRPVNHAFVEASNGFGDATAEDGSFTLRHIPSGENRLRIVAGGYRPAAESVRVPPGGIEHHDVDIQPMARLTVHLADGETGEPLGLTVFLRSTTPNTTNGAAAPATVKGETQFLNLEPGDYMIQADGADGAPAFFKPEGNVEANRPRLYGTVWYPGVSDQSMAETVHLEEGEQRSVDFRIRVHESFRAEGTIEAPRGYEGDPVALRFEDFQALRAWNGSARPRQGFYLDHLLPGKYAVAAIIGKPDDWQYAALEFEITGRDLKDLKLSFRPMANLFGSIRMAEDNTPVPENLVAFVTARNAWESPLNPFEAAPSAVRFTRGEFHVKGFIPTNYAAALRNLPRGYALTDVLYGNASLGDLSFPLEGTGQLTFVVTSKAGAITGIIRHSGDQPVPKRFLLLAPDSFNPQSSMLRIVEVESDPTGAFAFPSLAPGKYRLVVLRNQNLNPSSVAARIPGGQIVEVRPSATTAVTLSALQD